MDSPSGRSRSSGHWARGNRPVPTVEVLREAVAEIRPEAVEAVAYSMSFGDGPAAKALSLLLTRRLDGQTIGTNRAVGSKYATAACRVRGRSAEECGLSADPHSSARSARSAPAAACAELWLRAASACERAAARSPRAWYDRARL